MDSPGGQLAPYRYGSTNYYFLRSTHSLADRGIWLGSTPTEFNEAQVAPVVICAICALLCWLDVVFGCIVTTACLAGTCRVSTLYRA